MPVTLPSGSGGGFVDEVPGFRFDQLSTEYWFPWYDNLQMTTYLLIGNPGTAGDAHVTVSIAGNPMGSFTIPAGGRITPQFPIQDGPVHVVSDVTIFTSEQVYNSSGFTNQMMGAPKEELTTEWWFPWTDNFSMTTWILVANPSATATAHVTITIDNSGVGTYSIPPNGRVTPIFNLLDGPVHIVSDIPVVSSERIHTINGFVQETMGYPANRLTNDYWFPWYDDVTMSNWLHVGNTSTTLPAHVCIFIASNLVDNTIIPAGGRIYPVFSNVQSGPVEVVSDNPVVTSIREHTNDLMIQETMGQAANQLSTHYLLPSYNNTTLKSSILIGNPSTLATANVTVKINGVSVGTFTVPPQGLTTATIPNAQDGTVDIQSDIPVFLTERTAS